MLFILQDNRIGTSNECILVQEEGGILHLLYCTLSTPCIDMGTLTITSSSLAVQAELAPRHPARIFNTWVGEASKLILLEAVLNTIQR
jgi:hypothetical protein